MDAFYLGAVATIDSMADEPLLCSTPGCGNQLLPSRAQVRTLHAVFPQDLDEVRYLLAAGPRFVYCPHCRKRTEFPSSAMCIIRAGRLAVSYVPPEWLEESPDLMENTRRELERVGGEKGWRAIVVSDDGEFRSRIGHEIARNSVQTITSWQAAQHGGETAAREWFEQHRDQITPSFWASLRLIADGLVKIGIFFVPDQTVIPKIQRELAVLRGIWLFIVGEKEEGVDYEQWLATTVNELLEQVLTMWTGWLAERLWRDRQFSDIEESVDAAICGPALDQSMIQTLADHVTAMVERSTPQGAYALCAVLAAVCRTAKSENPLAAEWTRRYAGFELAFRAGRITEPGLRLPFAFAASTLSVQELWNCCATMINQGSKTHQMDPELPAFWSLVSDLQLDRQLGEIAQGTTHLDLSSLGDDQVRELAGEILVEIVGKGIHDVSELVRNVVRSHPHLGCWVAAESARLLLEAGQSSAAARMACRTAEYLNHRSRPVEALEALRTVRDFLRERGAWPPDLPAQIDFANETGNLLRTLGDREGALKSYEECRGLLAGLPPQRYHRVNERNIAIVLRELGRVDESLSLLRPLLDSAEGVEKAMVYNSIGAAHLMLHDYRASAVALEAGLALMPKGPSLAHERFNLLVSLHSAYLGSDDPLLARTLDDLVETAEQTNDRWCIASAAHAQAQAAWRTPGLDPAERADAVDRALPLLRPILEVPAEERPLPALYLPLVQAIVQLLLYAGEPDEAARAIDETLAEAVYRDDPGAWKLIMLRAICAQQLKKGTAPHEYLLIAMEAALESSSRVDPKADPFRLMSDRRDLQLLLGGVFVRAFARGAVDGALIRLVGDFQTSVVLSQRLHADAGLAGLEVPEGELARWLAGGEGEAEPIELIQCIETDEGLHLLLSRASGPTTVESRLLDWSAPAAEVQELSDRVAFALERAHPDSASNPLGAIPGWLRFANAFADAVGAAVPRGAMLCVVPGALSALPLHWIVAEANPLVYIPSLAAGAHFHRRRAALFADGVWRPRSLNDFVVWRAGERDSLAARFQSASAELEALCAEAGIQYQSVRGAAADRDQLLRLLSTGDAIRISCHGRAKPPLTFEFMLASNGSLPPSLPAYWHTGRATDHIFDWSALPAGLKCPPVVFSAACASGRTAVVEGGERVGLERALFRAGSLTYVAPQWSVPVDPIQALIHSIIRRYLTGSLSLARSVWEEAAAAESAGVPAWVARSIAIHGDIN